MLDLIEYSLPEQITLSTLAAEALVSERHFCTMFRQAMGLPPHRYLIERRLEQAKRLLRRKPPMSITDVALSVGFQSSAHFSTMFRKATGSTPTIYRRDE